MCDEYMGTWSSLIDEYMDQLPPEELSRYKKKLALCGLDDCPYRLPANVWSTDQPNECSGTEWPDVQFGDIFTYLIDTPGVHTIEAMKNYRDLESYKLLQSHRVLLVRHMKPADSDVTIFRTLIFPSLILDDSPHYPWVAIRSTGIVITAHCDCKAGLDESCAHIGALLHKIETIVRESSACTHTRSDWDAADMEEEDVPTAPVSQIQFYTEEEKQNYKASPPRPKPTPLSKEQQQAFLKKLAEITAGTKPPVGLSIFKSTAHLFYPKEEQLPAETPSTSPSTGNTSSKKRHRRQQNPTQPPMKKKKSAQPSTASSVHVPRLKRKSSIHQTTEQLEENTAKNSYSLEEGKRDAENEDASSVNKHGRKRKSSIHQTTEQSEEKATPSRLNAGSKGIGRKRRYHTRNKTGD